MKSQEEKMRVGFFQMDVEYENVQLNLEKLKGVLGKSSADLLVCPELCLSGYEISDRRKLRTLSQERENSLFDPIEALCITREMSVVFGFSEKYKDKIYNSSMLIDERGRRFVYRKTHLFLNEKKLFDRGDTGFFVVKTQKARVGMMICFDWFFPESARTLALMKAEVIAHPSNLVMPYCQDAMKTRCLENRVFAVTANRVGEEKNTKFTGKSRITDIKGNVLASGKEKGESVMEADLKPALAREKRINGMNDLFKERRRKYYVL